MCGFAVIILQKVEPSREPLIEMDIAIATIRRHFVVLMYMGSCDDRKFCL